MTPPTETNHGGLHISSEDPGACDSFGETLWISFGFH
jgi:hypothetical protein